MMSQNRAAALRMGICRASLLGLLLLPGRQAGAQTLGPPADVAVQDSAGHRPVRPVVNLDFRSSFIDCHHVGVNGINAGVALGPRRNQLTIGYYWLTYDARLRFIDWHRKAARRLNFAYYTKRDLWFGSLMYWRNIAAGHGFTLSLPVEMGAGVASATPTDWVTNQPVAQRQHTLFVPVQVGVYGEWRVTRWAGLNAQVGYRRALFPLALKEHYDGAYYSAGLTVYAESVKDTWHWLRSGRTRPSAR